MVVNVWGGECLGGERLTIAHHISEFNLVRRRTNIVSQYHNYYYVELHALWIEFWPHIFGYIEQGNDYWTQVLPCFVACSLAPVCRLLELRDS